MGWGGLRRWKGVGPGASAEPAVGVEGGLTVADAPEHVPVQHRQSRRETRRVAHPQRLDAHC